MSNKLKYALLLGDVKGYRKLSAFVTEGNLEGELTHAIISKGSLLVKLNKHDVSAIKETYGYNVNYAVYSVPLTDSYLLVGDQEVHIITREQRDFLYGIEGNTERVEVFKRLEWIQELTVDSEVYVTIATTPHPVKGVVRWIGKLPGEHGKKFGVELLEYKAERSREICDALYKSQQYFSCKTTNCAVIVAMDKLTDPQTAYAAKIMEPQSSSENEIKLGNLVTFYDVNNDKHEGIVRWIGKGDSDVHEGTKIIGIEVEGKITSEVPHSIKDMSHYFSVEKNSHSKIFLPITYVKKCSSPVKHKDDSGNLHPMPGLVEKRGNDDYFEDAPEIPVTNLPSGSPSHCEPVEQDFYDYQGSDSPKLKGTENMVRFQKGSEIVYNGHNGIIKWIGKLPRCNAIMAGLEMLEDYTVEDAKDGYWDNKVIYKCTPLRGTFVGFDKIQLAKNGAKRKVSEGDSTNPTKRPSIDEYSRFPQPATGLSSSHTSLLSSSVCLNQNPYKLDKGSAIQYGDPPKYGVIKQIRKISGCDKTLFADVEMDEIINGSTNDLVVGKKYLDSAPGKGKLLRLLDLLPSKRSPAKHPANDHLISSLNSKESAVEKFDNESGISVLKKAHPALENGCAVELGNPPDEQYGVIRWIRYIDAVNQAYVEMEDGSGQTFPLDVLRPDSRFNFNDSANKMEQKSKDGLDEPKMAAEDEPQIIPQKFEVGSMIEFGEPVQYGVIKRLHELHADVELDNGIHKLILLTEIRIDNRFSVDVNKTQGKNPLLSKMYIHEEKSVVPPDEIFNKDKHTEIKGIQGFKNSCYLDATMYGMFTFSNAFDIAFLDEVNADNETSIVQSILKNKIVYPLRVKGVVVQDSIEVFRSLLANLQNMKGLTSEEKDPEEFINLLFKHILHLEPFVTIRRPSGIDKEFLIQLFVESIANVVTVTTQELLTKMFKDHDITFVKYPTKLLLQVPRSGKKFKSFKFVIPSLQLDVSDLCKPSGSCFVCNKARGCICKECSNETFLKHKMNLYFCANCWPLWHQKSHRKCHKQEIATENDDDFDTGTLQLLSVLCIETSHYVCFTRITGSGKDEWVFFDSMAERQDNGYNIPQVLHCTDILNTYVYGENKVDISRNMSKESRELVRRFVEDAYLCIYVDHDGVMYQ